MRYDHETNGNIICDSDTTHNPTPLRAKGHRGVIWGHGLKIVKSFKKNIKNSS